MPKAGQGGKNSDLHTQATFFFPPPARKNCSKSWSMSVQPFYPLGDKIRMSGVEYLSGLKNTAEPILSPVNIPSKRLKEKYIQLLSVQHTDLSKPNWIFSGSRSLVYQCCSVFSLYVVLGASEG